MSNTENVPSTLTDDSTLEVGREDFNLDDPMSIPVPAGLSKGLDALVGEPALPNEVEEIPDPAEEVEEEDLTEDADKETDEVDEVNEDEADEELDDADEVSTDVVQMSEDEVDWETMVPDANGKMRSLADLRKGFTTEKHQSAQGRELHEARKAFEADQAIKIQQLNNMAQSAVSILYSEEEGLAGEFHNMEAKLKEARDNDEDFSDISELKDKREGLQAKYWAARHKREGLEQQASNRQEAVFQERWANDIKVFQETVTDHIPDFDEKVALDIREFAIAEGLPEDLINSVTDVALVKFVDNYRRLKQGTDKGAVKRKKAPVRKSPPKKAKPAVDKANKVNDQIKAKAFSPNATEADHFAYAKQLASKSLQT